ncbi:MAG: 3-dehydroquinate synthase [Spirochaetes bacterium]|nr:MAG: 3-dehydroquinate synthase [Spirochaetota bacterium]
MEIIEVKSEKPYKIYFGLNIFTDPVSIFEEYFQKQKKGGEIFKIITDRNVSRLYLRKFSKNLKKSGFNIKYTVLPTGESIKSIKYYHRLMRKMVKNGLTRDSVIIALGGGVIGDLSGFAASTYMRGCNFVQIPTTLLAQVDSSIGGKVGINLKEGKNLVGTFYSPKFVLIDPELLNTLNSREFIAGFAEVIKAALIFNKKMFDTIYTKVMSLRDRVNDNSKIDSSYLKDGLIKDKEFMNKVIIGAIKVKREVVQSDEFETGIRMILNFGHTFAHAIEKLTGYKKILHGEAVLFGMKIAVELSYLKGYIDKNDRNRVIEFLELFKIPSIKGITPKKILKQIKSDKKKRLGKINYILLKKIGDGYPDDSVEYEKLLSAIERFI